MRVCLYAQRQRNRPRFFGGCVNASASGKFYSKVMWPLCPSTVAILQPIVLSDEQRSWNAWHFDDLFLQKKKKGRMKEWREKGDKKKCAPSPHLFRRLPALSFSFWEELDRLWPSARGSSIPTAIFIHHQASLGSLYWGYSALHYIKKEEIEGY